MLWLVLPVAAAYAAYKGYEAASEAVSPEPHPAVTNLMCRVRPGQFDQMTTFIQGALHARDPRAAPYPSGIWDAQLCKDWWRVTKKPLTTAAVHELIPSTIDLCKQMQLPICEDPNKEVRGLLFAGGAALIAAYAYSRYKERT